jgi:hypothetical protein
MSRAASPIVKVGLILAVIVIGGAKVRTNDLPACSQEVTRCLAACRAVCARRITDAERIAKFPSRSIGDRIAA